MKLKADVTNVKGFLYIKSRTSNVYAVRGDYASGATYAWAKYVNGIATSWTGYSQTFVFSNSVTAAASTSIPTGTTIGVSVLNDLIIGFYSVGGKAYIDDVQLVETTGTAVDEVKDNDSFIVVKDHQISINDYNGDAVSVYNTTGQLVLKTNKAFFCVDRSGLYIVKMGNKTQKLIIK